MSEIKIKIPEDLKELETALGINWQRAVEKRMKEEFNEISRVKKILAKSKLSEMAASSLSDEVSLSLAGKYDKILKGK